MRKKILAPAGDSGGWAFGPHTRVAHDQAMAMSQNGPPAQF